MCDIDITMVSTLRPNLLRRTLDSWCDNMITDQSRYRLILHIDAIGESNCTPQEILKIAEEYFDNIHYKINEVDCGHAKAFRWCWNQVEAEYSLLIDDDWELLVKVDIDDMIRVHNEHKRLATLRLPKFPIPAGNRDMVIIKFFMPPGFAKDVIHTVHGNLLKVVGDKFNLLTINPSLFKGSFVKKVRKYLKDNIDPEIQFKFRGNEPALESEIRSWDIGMYANPGDNPYIKDIGREWMESHGIKKEKKSRVEEGMLWKI